MAAGQRDIKLCDTFARRTSASVGVTRCVTLPEDVEQREFIVSLTLLTNANREEEQLGFKVTAVFVFRLYSNMNN